MFSLFLLFSTRWILFSKENQPFKKNQWKSLYVFREAACAWEWVCVIQLLFQCIVIVREGIECSNCSFSIQFNQIRIWFSSFFCEFQLKYMINKIKWLMSTVNQLLCHSISFDLIPLNRPWLDDMISFCFISFCLLFEQKKKQKNVQHRLDNVQQSFVAD